MGLPSTTAPTPAPAPAPKPPTPPGSGGSTSTHPLAKYSKLTLKLWSRGEAVKAMQKAMGKLTVDGSFGRKTEARVKEYQKAKGLTVNGVVDAKVWKALMAPAKPAPTPPSSGTTSSALKTEFTSYKATTLKSGSTGAAVRVLQRKQHLRHRPRRPGHRTQRAGDRPADPVLVADVVAQAGFLDGVAGDVGGDQRHRQANPLGVDLFQCVAGNPLAAQQAVHVGQQQVDQFATWQLAKGRRIRRRKRGQVGVGGVGMAGHDGLAGGSRQLSREARP
jgi:peptidoglycan hydrolase-like protein with peptidoglycan-binding domain